MGGECCIGEVGTAKPAESNTREPASLELAQQNAALNRSIIEEAQGTIEVAKLNWASCQENPLCALPWESS
ncbi:hypothetical protein CYMTET_34102 [Cymbomonas tetramitiformis]|uniref:Uncharacterized protein n=1 Tax=Cymbomonas tetramitiformis TaxID=36881 RepID=A0AAE0FBL2_9CHLO|nr:hypothetical protein CYMTET_34102 [Cymbomonas tetramitiformis]